MTGTLFLNPSAGLRSGGQDVAALREAARGEGLEVIDVPSGSPLDIPRLVRQRMSGGQRLFVAAGGDGTIHHVIQALVRSEGELAVIPFGTYNHFARDLGIPAGWRDALEVAVRGRAVSVDVGRVNESYFVNNLSLGLYPELVVHRERRGRDYPRWKARLVALYLTLRRYPHVTLVIDTPHHQEVVRTHVFMASNNTYDLSQIGIEAPRPRLSEGLLGLYWLPHVPRIRLARFACRFVAGRTRGAAGFRSFRTTRAKVSSPHGELTVGMDGEVVTLIPPLVITSVPQALAVRVPR